ncbi:unnamed protein product [Amoebophrya sp. A120]|nr:unnamed protein product [Amoebophrya sp. A120]|eukprot:GSA120T00001287001.1
MVACCGSKSADSPQVENRVKVPDDYTEFEVEVRTAEVQKSRGTPLCNLVLNSDRNVGNGVEIEVERQTHKWARMKGLETGDVIITMDEIAVSDCKAELEVLICNEDEEIKTNSPGAPGEQASSQEQHPTPTIPLVKTITLRIWRKKPVAEHTPRAQQTWGALTIEHSSDFVSKTAHEKQADFFHHWAEAFDDSCAVGSHAAVRDVGGYEHEVLCAKGETDMLEQALAFMQDCRIPQAPQLSRLQALFEEHEQEVTHLSTWCRLSDFPQNAAASSLLASPETVKTIDVEQVEVQGLEVQLQTGDGTTTTSKPPGQVPAAAETTRLRAEQEVDQLDVTSPGEEDETLAHSIDAGVTFHGDLSWDLVMLLCPHCAELDSLHQYCLQPEVAVHHVSALGLSVFPENSDELKLEIKLSKDSTVLEGMLILKCLGLEKPDSQLLRLLASRDFADITLVTWFGRSGITTFSLRLSPEESTTLPLHVLTKAQELVTVSSSATTSDGSTAGASGMSGHRCKPTSLIFLITARGPSIAEGFRSAS